MPEKQISQNAAYLLSVVTFAFGTAVGVFASSDTALHPKPVDDDGNEDKVEFVAEAANSNVELIHSSRGTFNGLDLVEKTELIDVSVDGEPKQHCIKTTTSLGDNLDVELDCLNY